MTTNEMIYKTLTTKTTKEPKYKSVLEDMGFTIYDSCLSDYSYWAVKCEATGRILVISKDRNNKKGLFNPYSLIKHCGKNNDILKVDFAGYLKKHKYNRTIKGSEYEELRWKIKSYKYRANYKLDRVNEAKKAFDRALEHLECCKKEYRESIEELDKCRFRVAQLKES